MISYVFLIAIIFKVLALSWVNPPNTSRVQISGNGNVATSSPSRPGRNVVHFSRLNCALETQQSNPGPTEQIPAIGPSRAPTIPTESSDSRTDNAPRPGTSRLVASDDIDTAAIMPSTPSPRKRGKMAAVEHHK
ncbi:uncharacterized protein PGTG_21260 [Puccinia graminis f. sp. tritici CRL 75-36-700-3]|uniref:Secreted protein n=1 Tax=Puccinia graminis f. sp. tritici (strain CRL 75-36-700-3 / race SCCL) TaxID=418459 RepID=H6QQV9_PUCGT|nr:uncharacterized protein PGTG_21260 [Puccinia graminis f. sp. tritici CRL 75-36-700-3]EHS62888.1 hypothetical protein PGTG_21260 [Puccinia graminis f. sp. tritici CRL 75-36-700-3]